MQGKCEYSESCLKTKPTWVQDLIQKKLLKSFYRKWCFRLMCSHRCSRVHRVHRGTQWRFLRSTFDAFEGCYCSHLSSALQNFPQWWDWWEWELKQTKHNPFNKNNGCCCGEIWLLPHYCLSLHSFPENSIQVISLPDETSVQFSPGKNLLSIQSFASAGREALNWIMVYTQRCSFKLIKTHQPSFLFLCY